MKKNDNRNTSHSFLPLFTVSLLSMILLSLDTSASYDIRIHEREAEKAFFRTLGIAGVLIVGCSLLVYATHRKNKTAEKGTVNLQDEDCLPPHRTGQSSIAGTLENKGLRINPNQITAHNLNIYSISPEADVIHEILGRFSYLFPEATAVNYRIQIAPADASHKNVHMDIIARQDNSNSRHVIYSHRIKVKPLLLGGITKTGEHRQSRSVTGPCPASFLDVERTYANNHDPEFPLFPAQSTAQTRFEFPFFTWPMRPLYPVFRRQPAPKYCTWCGHSLNGFDHFLCHW